MSEPTFKAIEHDLAQQLFDSRAYTVYVSYTASDGIEHCYVAPRKMRAETNPTFYITTELYNKLMNKRTPQQAFIDSKPAQEAWLAGKPLQHKHVTCEKYNDFIPSSDLDIPYFLDPSFQWRPKPEPEKVPFNQQTIPADAWFRIKGNNQIFKATALSVHSVRFIHDWHTYSYIAEMAEHSTDRINWQPCYILKTT